MHPTRWRTSSSIFIVMCLVLLGLFVAGLFSEVLLSFWAVLILIAWAIGFAIFRATRQGTSTVDAVDALERLGKLRDSGAITQAEFDEKKAKLLPRI